MKTSSITKVNLEFFKIGLPKVFSSCNEYVLLLKYYDWDYNLCTIYIKLSNSRLDKMRKFFLKTYCKVSTSEIRILW
jgi:hypothetical protein